MKRVSVLPNQRINIDDYEDGAGGRLVQKEHSRQAVTLVLPTDGDRQARIFSGFDLDPVSLGVDTAITINRGTGIFPIYTDQNELLYGYVFGDEGDDSFFLDMAGAGNATHDVYVKASGTLAEFKNRVFWNPDGASEYVDNVSTRFVTQWSATYVTSGATPPGNGEWVKVYEVTKAGGVITAVADKRKFYFEGAKGASFAQEWGDGANDRNASRETYGVGDLHKWAQAVRRQLDDIIGATGWYKAIPASLTELAPLNGRFVTIDQPGGPAGNYATIAAAVTALNGADGGTILLREGAYSIAAQITVTKPINIIGVEGIVDIQNASGEAADYAIIYDTGSEGSLIQNVQFSDGTNYLHLSVAADRIKVERCKFFGGAVRSIGGEVVWEGCNFTGLTGDDTIPVIQIDAGSGSQTWRNCTILAGTEYTRNDTIKTGGTFSGIATFEDCVITGNTDATNSPRLVYATVGSVRLVRCQITTAPFQAASSGQLSFYSASPCEMIGCQVTVKAAVASNLKCPVLQYSYAGFTVSSSLLIRHCYFNFGSYMPDTTLPVFVIEGMHSELESCVFAAIKIPNSVTNATALETIFEIAPKVKCCLDDCRFMLITSEGANDINISLIGQHAANTNPGIVVFNGCYIDGSSRTYRNAADDSNMISYPTGAGAAQIQINNCFFSGGAWAAVIALYERPSIVTGNRLEFTTALGSDIDIHVDMSTPGTTDDPENCLIFSNNICTLEDITANMHIRLYNASRVVCVGNVVMSVGGTPPTDSINILDATSATAIANNTSEGISYTAVGTEVPITANLADYNVMA